MKRLLFCAILPVLTSFGGEPLSLWEPTGIRQTLLSQIESVTTIGSKDFLPPSERFAYFDCDGTVLCEKPVFLQNRIAAARLAEKAGADPALRGNPLYQAASEGKLPPENEGWKWLGEAFAGETKASCQSNVRSFLDRRDPSLGIPFGKTLYTPMVQLVEYLKKNQFRIFLVSTSDQDLVEVVCSILELPADQACGTRMRYRAEDAGDSILLTRLPSGSEASACFEPINFSGWKVVNLSSRGLPPATFVFGNSTGDIPMLKWAAKGKAHFAYVVDHDDASREFSYQSEELLEEARRMQWGIISMKNDFVEVFGK